MILPESPSQSMTRRALFPALLTVSTGAMVVTARVPEEGAGWRTAFVVTALIGFVLLWCSWRQVNFSTREVLGLAVLLRFIASPLQPVLSDDGFRYVWDGLVQVEVGENPYRYVPADPALKALHGEEIYDNLNSAQYYSVYPPLSQIVFALGALPYPLRWELSWYLIKLIMNAAEIAGLIVLSRMVSSQALMLYAWNPLVIIETAGQAHTETLVAPLLIFAVWWGQRGKGGVAVGALTAAGWVKLYPILLLPFAVRRFGIYTVVVALAASVLMMLPYYSPDTLLNMANSIGLYYKAFEFNAGPYYILKIFLHSNNEELWFSNSSMVLISILLLSLSLIYWRHVRSDISLQVEYSLVIGIFIMCSSTVHPWYLVPVTALIPMIVGNTSGKYFGIAWIWLGAFSMATYWRYAGPPWGYTVAVATGWLGWALCLGMAGFVIGMPVLMRVRARSKWSWIRAHLPVPIRSVRVLDLGAGEGYVGEALQLETGAEVILADVLDLSRTDLPSIHYDGRSLSCEPDYFDLTLLVYVLHHSSCPEEVLTEAKRVTRGYVVVIESVEEHPFQRWLFEPLDRLANRMRSGGAMRALESFLHIRTDAEWRTAFTNTGLQLIQTSRKGIGVHRSRLYVLKPLS